MTFLPAEYEIDDDNNTITCTIGEACTKDLNKCPLPRPIENTTLVYYLARTQLFMERIGIDTKNKMAHYAKDCWDAELLTYDLAQHSKATGVKLEAESFFDIKQ